MANCSECEGLMEWPRQCAWCKGWFCDSHSTAYAHDCPEYDSEPSDFYDDEPESDL